MKRTFQQDLERNLGDPEFAALFYNTQKESLKELNRVGIIPVANFTSLEMNKTKYIKWEVKRC